MFKKMVSFVLVIAMTIVSCNWDYVAFAAGNEITVDMTFEEIAALPGMTESGVYLYGGESDTTDPTTTTLSSACKAMADDAAVSLNAMLTAYNAGTQVTHNIYSEEEIAADPTKANVKLYFTPSDTPNSKFVIIAPGGAYAFVSTLGEGYTTAGAFHEKGYNAFVLDYRCADNARNSKVKNAPNEDLAAAVKYIMAHAAELNVNVEDYLLIGGSAGGHLVGEWATDNYGYGVWGQPAPKAIILLYPLVALDIPESSLYETGKDITRTLLDIENPSLKDAGQLNVADHLLPDAPPIYLIAGGKDSLTVYEEQAAALIAQMDDYGIVYSGIKYEGLGHGLIQYEQSKGWLDKALAFCENPQSAPIEIVEEETTTPRETESTGEDGLPINIQQEIDVYTKGKPWTLGKATNTMSLSKDGTFYVGGTVNVDDPALRQALIDNYNSANGIIQGLLNNYMDINTLPDPWALAVEIQWEDQIVYRDGKLQFSFNKSAIGFKCPIFQGLADAKDGEVPITASTIETDPQTGETTITLRLTINNTLLKGTFELKPQYVLSKSQTKALIKALGGEVEETTTAKPVVPETTTEPETGVPSGDEAVTVPYNPVTPDGTAAKSSVKAYATPTELMDSAKFNVSDSSMAQAKKVIFGKDESGNEMKWYIVGYDAQNAQLNPNAGKNIVLFATSPIRTTTLTYHDTSKAMGSWPYTDWVPWSNDYGTTNTTPTRTERYQYGQSLLRSTLNSMSKNTSYFTTDEQNIMLSSTITSFARDKTSAIGGEKFFRATTNDILYAPHCPGLVDHLKVGAGSNTEYGFSGSDSDAMTEDTYYGTLSVNGAATMDWKPASDSEFWTRTMRKSGTNRNVATYKVNSSGTVSFGSNSGVKATESRYVIPAFDLNLADVLFASSAKPTGNGKLAADEPMKFRLSSQTLASTAEYTNNSIKIVPSEADGQISLVVQGNNNGEDWYYSKAITGTNTVKISVADIKQQMGVTPDVDNCKIWIEKASGNNSSVSYAKMATKANAYIVKKDGNIVNEYFSGEVYKLPNTILSGFYDGTKLYKSATPVRVYSDMNFRSITLKVDTTYGAGIKLTSTNLLEESGIRFGATITVTDLEGNSVADLLDPSKAIVKGGMLITTNDLYENNGTLTLDSDYKTINIVNQGWFNGVTGKYYGSLLGIAYGNFQRQFVAKAYISVQYEYEEQPTILYGNVSEPRSVHDVATNIKKPENAEYYSSLPQAHKDIVDAYAG